MADFLTIRLEQADAASLDPILSADRAYAIRKALASLLELELKRDFQSVNVTLHEPKEGPAELVVGLRAPHDLTKLTADETKFLATLNEMLSESPYQVHVGGAIQRDGTDLPGMGIDWRAAMRAVNQQGAAMMPGLLASIIDGAEEVEKRQR